MTELDRSARETSAPAGSGSAPAEPLLSNREKFAQAGRIVVKVGSSSLTRQGQIDPAKIEILVDALAERQTAGGQVLLVSSGAIAAGIGPLGLSARPRDLATQQAAAGVGQGMLIERYATAFAGHGLIVGQVLLTADDFHRRGHYHNASRTLERLLSLGVVPVVNENDAVATHEIRFGDNDRLAALVAHLVRADALLMLSDTDGLYTDDPRRPAARLIPEVAAGDRLEAVRVGNAGSGIGSGGMVTKLDAARIATSAGIPVLLTSAAGVSDGLAGRGGTFFAAGHRRTSARLFWLRHVSTPRGRLTLDPGAVDAVVGRRLSLLAAGIVAVDGDFSSGDPVELADTTGRVLARGLAGLDSSDLLSVLGMSTRQMPPELRREAVHRDDLILL